MSAMEGTMARYDRMADFYVVGLQEAGVAAAREPAAAPIPAQQQPPEPGWDRATSSTDSHHHSVRTLGHHLQTAVARQPTGHDHMDRVAALQLCLALVIAGQVSGRHVDHHAGPVGVRIFGQSRRGQSEEGIAQTRGVRHRRRVLLLLRLLAGDPLQGLDHHRAVGRRQAAGEPEALAGREPPVQVALVVLGHHLLARDAPRPPGGGLQGSRRLAGGPGRRRRVLLGVATSVSGRTWSQARRPSAKARAHSGSDSRAPATLTHSEALAKRRPRRVQSQEAMLEAPSSRHALRRSNSVTRESSSRWMAAMPEAS
jgi:hypothetical protein